MAEIVYLDEFLLRDQTTGSGWVQLGGRDRSAVLYVTWGDTVTDGEVKIETAPEAAYGGKWSPLAQLGFAPGQTRHVQLSGALMVIRATITKPVTGGTVTVRLVAN